MYDETIHLNKTYTARIWAKSKICFAIKVYKIDGWQIKEKGVMNDTAELYEQSENTDSYIDKMVNKLYGEFEKCILPTLPTK